MKRIGSLFKDSFLELGALRNITLMAMFLALYVVLSVFGSFLVFSYLKISFAFLALAVTGMMFGPTAGFFVGALGDIIQYVVKPLGAFNPALTLIAALGGMIWGLLLYRNKATILRVIIAKSVITVVCNMLLTTIVLLWFYGLPEGKSLEIYVGERLLKNALLLPVEIALAFLLCKAVGLIEAKVRRS